MEFVRRVVQGFKWSILDGVDPNPKNIVGATVLHTSEGGKFGCLLRLEPNIDTQVSQTCLWLWRETLLTIRRCSASLSVLRMKLSRPSF